LSPAAKDVESQLSDAAKGDRVALARLLSTVERGGEAARAVAALAYREPPPYSIGITGAPGAGKSTLTDQLITTVRAGWPAEGEGDVEPVHQVAVLAVDPSSPFSGGAILGDRIRMQAHATDPGVFIRSMATRGHLGGLSAATGKVVTVLDAAGKDVVLIETVGVGQDEVEIVSTADVSVVVLVPGLGDEVQALKAGIMEIADVFAVNKADRAGVERVVAEIETLLSLAPEAADRPAVVKTVATRDEGVEALLAAILDFHRRAGESGALQRNRRAQLRRQLEEAVRQRVMDQVRVVLAPAELQETVERMAARAVDPFTAADQIARRMGLP